MDLFDPKKISPNKEKQSCVTECFPDVQSKYI